MKSSPKLYNFDALYENCKETFENPKGTPLQKKSKFRKKISVICLNVEIPTGYYWCIGGGGLDNLTAARRASITASYY